MRRSRWACALLVILGTVVRLRQLDNPLTGSHAFRQTQTAFPIWEYSRHGIDLLKTPLPIFGTQRNIPFEFPLFQAIGALVTHLGFTPATSGRITALFFFQVTGVLTWLLMRRWQPQAAFVCLLLFEFLPFGLHWGATGLIDSLSTASGLGMVLALDRWFAGRSRWFLTIGSICSWVLFLVKPTTVPTMGVLLVLAAALHTRELGWQAVRRRIVSGFLLGPVLAFFPLELWTRYADAVKARSSLTEFATSGRLTTWNFGTVSQRLEGFTYLKIASRMVQDSCGYLLPAMLVLGLVTLYPRFRFDRILLLGIVLAVISSPLVFFNLYFVHTYYILGIYPVLAMLVAVLVTLPFHGLKGWGELLRAIAGLVVILAAVATPIGQDDLAEFVREPPVPSIIGDFTPTGSPLVMIGCDWNPSLLYYAHRQGLMLRSSPDPKVWLTNRISTYRYLYSCNQALSPSTYLPEGRRTIPTGHAGLYRIER